MTKKVNKKKSKTNCDFSAYDSFEPRLPRVAQPPLRPVPTQQSPHLHFQLTPQLYLYLHLSLYLYLCIVSCTLKPSPTVQNKADLHVCAHFLVFYGKPSIRSGALKVDFHLKTHIPHFKINALPHKKCFPAIFNFLKIFHDYLCEMSIAMSARIECPN